MGTDVKLGRALEGVQRGLSLTVTDDDTRRFVGYVVGLQALLAAPDAVIDAIRVLYDQVLELDPDVGHILAALHPLG
ncbi:MAG: hypothetical protein AVDCRST_MAG93-9183 [uncultured Chloroflexia bacterium]|uniref:Uncharacterized protein n=1 Tax=uncultured Chloroflexia bacterium TaxID=1672391 RepID=A0A6J4NC78_9CHLR|nr:MAG: hypothetical protein AVDCRST_MAG93-9183 [uncultured Chloroflexia bacterium]